MVKITRCRIVGIRVIGYRIVEIVGVFDMLDIAVITVVAVVVDLTSGAGISNIAGRVLSRVLVRAVIVRKAGFMV